MEYLSLEVAPSPQDTEDDKIFCAYWEVFSHVAVWGMI